METTMTAPSPMAEDVIELPLLIPEWQLECLEDAAHEKNMTVGQYVRRLFTDMFADQRPANY
jgi:hypothetical protein